MAWTAPDPGRLRHAVRFEGRDVGDNVGGVVMGPWQTKIPRRMSLLLPLLGGEAVRADRLSGVTRWTLTIRQDSETRRLTADDRVVEIATGRIFAMGPPIDPEGLGFWLVIDLVEGAEDGEGTEGT